MSEMPFDQAKRQRLLDYFGITKEDLEALTSLRQVAERLVDPFLHELYDHFHRFPETAAFFPDEATRQGARVGQRRHYLMLFSRDVGEEFFRRSWSIGDSHDRIGLEPRWYMGCYAKYFSATRLAEFLGQSIGKQPEVLQAIAKVVSLDVALVWESYYYQAREARLREAHASLEQRHRDLEGVHRIAVEVLNQRVELTERYEKEIEELRRRLGEVP